MKRAICDLIWTVGSPAHAQAMRGPIYATKHAACHENGTHDACVREENKDDDE